jgi:hypothetical protein
VSEVADLTPNLEPNRGLLGGNMTLRKLSLAGIVGLSLSLWAPCPFAEGARVGSQVAKLLWSPRVGVRLQCEVMDYTEGVDHVGARLVILGPKGQKLFSQENDAFHSAVPLLLPGQPGGPEIEQLLLVEWRDGQTWDLQVLRYVGTRVIEVVAYGFKVEHYLLFDLDDDAVPEIVTWDWVPDERLPTVEWPLVGTVHRWASGSFVDEGVLGHDDMQNCLRGRVMASGGSRAARQ